MVKNCGSKVHFEIASKEFIELLKTTATVSQKNKKTNRNY
jgi:hypothetical protein